MYILIGVEAEEVVTQFILLYCIVLFSLSQTRQMLHRYILKYKIEQDNKEYQHK